METDWTVACAADDPWIVVPWFGGDNTDPSLRYIDLRAQPHRIAEIPEAARHPSLAAALRRWNLPLGPVFTAKCDVWSYPARLFDAFDLPVFACAQGSYIDLVPARPETFASFAATEALLRNCSTRAGEIPAANARCEWVLRHARVFPGLPDAAKPADGFAITLYVWGYGSALEEVSAAWSAALTALVDPVLAGLG